MTGLVVVSHSRALADAAVQFVTGLLPGLDVPIALASGMPDGSLGTDATAVMEAIARVDDGEGVLIIADVGSGVMSSHTAIDLLEPDLACRTRLSAAPFVEGLLAAYAAAGTGQSFAAVCAQAQSAAEDKRRHVEG